MPRFLISLGANLGNVRETMHAASRLLFDAFGQANVVLSHLYRTPPVGGPTGQGDFLNAVAAIQTDLAVWDVWDMIKSIETNLGRQRLHRWEARRIDIDLLLYDNQRIWTPHLKVPHPRMCMRTFVIKPAMEIVPQWIEPVTGWTIEAMAKHLDDSTVQSLPIQVICSEHASRETLQSAFDEAQGSQSVAIEWRVMNPAIDRSAHGSAPASSPEDSTPQAAAFHRKTRLTIVAVPSPDPTTVLWEDFSRPWANWLNMQEARDPQVSEPPFFQGPRYLMPINDTRWAVHEIRAADLAMLCAVEVAGSFA